MAALFVRKQRPAQDRPGLGGTRYPLSGTIHAAKRPQAPLAQVPGTWLCSLQKGVAAQEAHAPPPGMDLAHWTVQLHDFADTAALIANLDLVITIDTAVAHLAGAMGKPVWLLLHFHADWRWMLDRNDSPWYPTLRLFRQPAPGDWETPVYQAMQALQQMVRA